MNARAQRHQHTRVRSGISQRISDRERRALACVRELQVHARVLITEAETKREILAMLRRVFLTLRRSTAVQHAAHDNAPNRASDDQFRQDCRRAMARYGVTATEAARVIVEQIAAEMSPAAREELLRPSIWRSEQQQIRHLADRLRR